jgi:hypothetical protein
VNFFNAVEADGGGPDIYHSFASLLLSANIMRNVKDMVELRYEDDYHG